MLQQGFGFTTLHVWRRCWQLYVAHLILFLFYTAQIGYVAEHFGNPMYMEEMNVTRLLEEPSFREGAARLGASLRRDAADGALMAVLEDLPVPEPCA